MDYDDLRTMVRRSGFDVFTFIDAAIAVAAADDGVELRRRRDVIVEKLYAATCAAPALQRCQNCDGGDGVVAQRKGVSPATPQSVDNREEEEEDEEEELDPCAGLFDDEPPRKILDIKKQLEDPDQSEDSLVELLQSLVDMDISFQDLKDTDIGRHVSQLRKQQQSEVVRRLAKQLVRKWKGTVDEWVKLHGEEPMNSVMVDGDSPQQKIHQNGHHQVPDFGYSPNPHNGSSGSDKNNSEPEHKPKMIPRREVPPKPTQSVSPAPAAQNRQREQRERNLDADDKLASARKRLQANYKEAENAKQQRTIQVMDIHEIPKPKNSFIAKNKGGGGSGSHPGRHW
ncbi:probable mediator of RNA polymerase II transcription subunit 26c [Argentina anserina]|uniref:probable mediator of RNA polymerase II transcription subunit 26c n=1 Tax=Argentina anserina TaxID=57926 RepID=UPI0021763F61|nr:probable mediator of RNA polymerase II transcription subunit 26c [Potentilla anserina]